MISIKSTLPSRNLLDQFHSIFRCSLADPIEEMGNSSKIDLNFIGFSLLKFNQPLKCIHVRDFMHV